MLKLLSVSLDIFSGLGPCPAVMVPGIGPRTPAELMPGWTPESLFLLFA